MRYALASHRTRLLCLLRLLHVRRFLRLLGLQGGELFKYAGEVVHALCAADQVSVVEYHCGHALNALAYPKLFGITHILRKALVAEYGCGLRAV
jgi:hypothetical protein